VGKDRPWLVVGHAVNLLEPQHKFEKDKSNEAVFRHDQRTTMLVIQKRIQNTEKKKKLKKGLVHLTVADFLVWTASFSLHVASVE
jgi:hypothetical protein